MKTVMTAVEGTVKIWAIPKSAWTLERETQDADAQNLPAPFPFAYELRTGQAYENGAVMVAEVPTTLWVPAGINLLAKAVETLNTAIEEERKDSALRIAEFRACINNLLQLEFKPETDEAVTVEGVEVLEPEKEAVMKEGIVIPGEEEEEEEIDGYGIEATEDQEGNPLVPPYTPDPNDTSS